MPPPTPTEPAYGHTHAGQPVHAHTHHFMGDVTRQFTPAAIKRDLADVEGLNAKLAVLLTRVVGTMWCFYLFNIIALPAVFEAVRTGSLIPIINAVSSNWIQLVLLPGIMVGQAVQAVAADRRSAKTFDDTERILDRLDEHTAGGLRTVLDQIQTVGNSIAELHQKHDDAHT